MYGQFTLDNFYQSKAWIKCYTLLRLERTDENGNLICWHCHKPIVHKYDAIAHHTIFLTEMNVNDTSISLNPILYSLCIIAAIIGSITSWDIGGRKCT